MPTCSNCQTEVSADANACPGCGAVFETTESQPSSQSPRSGSESYPTSIQSQQLLRVAQGLAGFSIVCALVVIFTPQSVLGARSGGLLLPAMILLWLITIGGLWTRTEAGLLTSIIGYALATVLSALGTASPLLGLRGLRLHRILPVDPGSLLLRAVYSFQLSSGGLPRVRSISFLIAGFIGTASLAVVTVLLVKNRSALVVEGTTGGQQSAGQTESPANSKRMVTLSGILLVGSVVVVLAASLLGLNGFDSAPIALKVISAGLPTPLAALVGYLRVTQPGTFDSSINVPVVALIGISIPLAVTLDAVTVRRQTDWTPSLFWYPIGVVFVWFLALPIYLYRRSTKI